MRPEPMKPISWNKDMDLQETSNLAYWERNMIALLFATTVNAFVELLEESDFDLENEEEFKCGWYYDEENNWAGWKRVISLYGGKVNFHIPDNFDLGALPEIDVAYNGHTTEQKWASVMQLAGCDMSLVPDDIKEYLETGTGEEE